MQRLATDAGQHSILMASPNRRKGQRHTTRELRTRRHRPTRDDSVQPLHLVSSRALAGFASVGLAKLPSGFVDSLHDLIAREHADGAPPILGRLGFRNSLRQFGDLLFENFQTSFDSWLRHGSIVGTF